MKNDEPLAIIPPNIANSSSPPASCSSLRAGVFLAVEVPVASSPKFFFSGENTIFAQFARKPEPQRHFVKINLK